MLDAVWPFLMVPFSLVGIIVGWALYAALRKRVDLRRLRIAGALALALWLPFCFLPVTARSAAWADHLTYEPPAGGGELLLPETSLFHGREGRLEGGTLTSMERENRTWLRLECPGRCTYRAESGGVRLWFQDPPTQSPYGPHGHGNVAGTPGGKVTVHTRQEFCHEQTPLAAIAVGLACAGERGCDGSYTLPLDPSRPSTVRCWIV